MEQTQIENKHCTVKVIFLQAVKDKIDIFTKEFNQEIGGWLCGEIKNNEIIIDNLLIPEQETSSAEVEITGKDLVKLFRESNGETSRIIGHWHSHHTMGAFWSSIDENNMNKIIAPRKIFMFLVTSTSGYKLRLMLNESIKFNIEDLEITVDLPNKDLLLSECQEIWKNKVKEKKYDYTAYQTNTQFHYQDEKIFCWVNNYTKELNIRVKKVFSKEVEDLLTNNKFGFILENYGVCDFYTIEKEYQANFKYIKKELQKLNDKLYIPSVQNAWGGAIW